MKSGFSLIEILAVLGLFAIMAALVLFGITAVQKNGRDSTRKATLGEIAAEVNDYRKTNRNYPNTNQVVFNTDDVTISGQKVLDLKGSSRSGTETSSSTTKYYYEKSTAGFVLCAKLESGSIESAGNVKDGCVGKL